MKKSAAEKENYFYNHLSKKMSSVKKKNLNVFFTFFKVYF